MIVRILALVWGLLFALPALADTGGGAGFNTDPRLLIFLFGLLLMLVGALYGFSYGWRLLIGFVQHRRACRLDAVLETKSHRFEGHVVTIGLNGCRFQPANKTTELRLLALLSGKEFNDFDVSIGGVQYPVFVDGFHLFYAPIYFFDPITRTELRQILRASTIAPYLVAHIGHATTRQNWQEDIERRKARIRSLKALHEQGLVQGHQMIVGG